MMRTTLNIDDDVLQTAKELAAMRETTAGKVLSELARAGLQPQPQPHPPIVRNGVPLLPARDGAQIVTLAAVNRLRDDEGS